MSTDPPTKDDWQARIASALQESVAAAGRAVTRAPAVQHWLRTRAVEIGLDLENPSAEAQARTHRRLLDGLDDHLPGLFDAVDTATAGCATLNLHWRPLAPDYTRLYLDFGRGFDVQVFVRLDDPTPAAAITALQRVLDALPRGAPFPKRPNEAGGVIAVPDRCVGVRVFEHLTEQSARRRALILRPPDGRTLEDLSTAEAVEQLVALLKGKK